MIARAVGRWVLSAAALWALKTLFQIANDKAHVRRLKHKSRA